MSSGNYEIQILDAIQMIVDNAVSKADFDKTIQGTISRCVDPTIGKYIVKYQNSSFYAYSSNIDTTYSVGTLVYVLVPGNDMSKDKTIIGAVDKLGPDYVSIIEGEDGYEVVGVNNIKSQNSFELCSYNVEDIKILYDRDDADKTSLDLDIFGFESYIKKSNSIICGATFKTALPIEQKFRGNYGIIFLLDFIDPATGETVTKNYVVDVDQMTGNPYNYTIASRQYGIFEVDGANFVSVKQIYIFCYDFPNSDIGKPNDIFVSKVELSAANALDTEELSSCALTFITPQGTYFDDNDLDSATRTLQAQVKIKGKAIDNDSQSVQYYWFIENNNITNKSEYYNQYGGSGWKCLNQKNIVMAATEDTAAVVQWVNGGYQYITAKSDNVARETTYKCVAVYNNDTVVSKTIIIYNYSSDYEISIKSDSGIAFQGNRGNPTLTCYINGKEEVAGNYTYVWSEINSNNQFKVLNETTDANNNYNNAVAARDQILNEIQTEMVLKGSAQEDLNTYENIINSYEKIQRVESNKIHNLNLNTITNFSTYKCSVYYGEDKIFIGATSIIISNSLTDDEGYYLTIENGNQVFKYNEKGLSPASPAVEKPITVMPVSFTLYDKNGQKINFNTIGLNNIQWVVPNNNTMITVSSVHGGAIEENNSTKTYSGYAELNFDISNKYDVKKDNNEIQLVIKYKDKVLSAKTNFLFTKEGEDGTNGTDFICKILPNTKDNSILTPSVLIDETIQNYTLNYTPKEENKWFKAQLWKDGELIFEGTESGNSTEAVAAQIKWSVLQNNYGNNIKDESNLAIDINTGATTFDLTKYEQPANIIKCEITYNDVVYYATIPVIVSRVISSDYKVSLTEGSGFKKVIYTTDGQSPSYDTELPFDITVIQEVAGIPEDISLLELSEYKVDYDWNVLGNVYYSDWQSQSNLIEKTIYGNKEKRNQKFFKPVDIYNGLCVNNAVECLIKQGEQEIGSIHIPIHFYLNRYGNAAMNGWDGNSVSIDENNSGVILAPQVGAGKKNEDNSFTGVFMGSVKEAGKEKEEYGLFGYNAGQRTIALNSEDGSARFGVAGGGQIVIDPSTGSAVLKSGNFDREAGTGMQIDLSKPSIEFGSGKFGVNSEGQMFAEGFATSKYVDDVIKDVDTKVEDLGNSIKTLEVNLNTNTLLIPCSSTHIPNYTQDYTIYFTGQYKGKEVSNIIASLISEDITGIAVDIHINKIIFSVDNTVPIEKEINNFTFKFTYTDPETSEKYSIEKQITIGLAIQGAIGETGSQGPTGDAGKSAYQVWLEAGNVGTEEDYLESLKGEKGDSGSGAEYIGINANSLTFTLAVKDDTVIGDTDEIEQVQTLSLEEESNGSEEKFYYPEYITLVPDFQNVVFDKWEYTLNGGEGWITLGNETSEDGMVQKAEDLGIIIEDDFTLRIPSSCPLFSEQQQSIIFRCVSKSGIYNAITISKTYESNILTGMTFYYGLSTSIIDAPDEDAQWAETASALDGTQFIKDKNLKYAQENFGYTYEDSVLEDGTVQRQWYDDKGQEVSEEDVLLAADNKYTNCYIWQKAIKHYLDGNSEESIPVCLSASKYILQINPQYYEQQAPADGTVIPPAANIEWNYVRPELKEGYFIWERLETIWSDNSRTYSIPTYNEESQKLQDKIDESADKILNSLTGEGTVRIFKNQILLLSGQEIETSDQVIILSSGGIAFYDKQGKNANTQLVFLEGQEEWVIQDAQGNYSNFTSTWEIDGTFNADTIDVKNLNSESITGGKLYIGNNVDNDTNYDAEIVIVKDGTSQIARLTEEGIIVYIGGRKKNTTTGEYLEEGVNGLIKITAENGLQSFAASGEMAFQSNAKNDGFQANKMTIEKYVDYGDALRSQVIKIQDTDANGTVLKVHHAGIGFIKI